MRLVTPAGARSGWPKAPARSLFTREQRAVREEDGVVTAFRDGQVTLRSLRRQEGFTNAIEEIGYQGVRFGDLVIHSMDGFAGAIGVSDSDGKASPVVHCYRPSAGVDVRYYAYFLRDLAIRGYITSLAKGIRERSTAFDVETFRSLVLPVPTLDEQRAIADYLDVETARIDALITKKQRMIELAERRWVALVQTYLTTDCTLVPLRRLLSRLPEYGAGESGIEPVEGWPRYIRITDIDVEGGLRAEDALSLSPDVARPYLLEDGDLLLARSGATVGRSLLFDHSMGEAAYAGYLIRFRFDDRRLRPALAFYWTLTDHYWSQVRMAALQATIENVSAEKFKDFMVPVPPLESQGRLEGRLAVGRLQLQRLLTSTTRQIDLLREHRQALITAAVTGEIEVPGVAA